MLSRVDADVAQFARLFEAFLHQMEAAAQAGVTSAFKETLDAHLGADCRAMPIISETFAPYDHANVAVALDAYLEAEERSYDLIGLSGQQRHYGSLSDLIEMGEQSGVGLGSVDHVNLAVGPEETMAAVDFGIYLVRDAGVPLVVLLRGPQEQHGPEQGVSLEILSSQQDPARLLLSEVRRLMVELNVFRGQVLSFGQSRMGFMGAGPVIFHPRPNVGREELVFAPGLLESVERQIVGIATHRDRLRASRQHVKRGLLLYGPPGNGKTLIVRHLLSRLTDHTVVLLTGWGLQMIEPACALARMLQPSVMVLEDVDLVAMDRGMSPLGNPILFELLNQMDGVADDADVSFVLTTNRADLLEAALAARPGRIDLAVEIGLPDAAALRRLIELFGRGLDLRLENIESIVAKTSGVAASLIKELLRKAAVIAALGDGDGEGRVSVTDTHVNMALDELLSEGGALTRALIGGAPAGDGSPPGPMVAGPMGMMPPSGGAVWAVTVGRQRRSHLGR
jgi:hypothetical protein